MTEARQAKKAGRGRPWGSKALSAHEMNIIREGLAKAVPMETVATLLGRGRSTVYKAAAAMQAEGSTPVLDLGQLETLIAAQDERGAEG